jgi:DNA repair photolyase
VVAWQRRAEVLTHPKLPCLAEFHTLNLSAGCPNECRYCYAQSYAHHPGWGTVAYYANALEKLRGELARPRVTPRLVYFSTASEPFVPAERVLDDLFAIMALLLERGTALLISTKGVIPDRFGALFAQYPGRVHVQVGITTARDAARALIEPSAASVAERLDNLARLAGAGVSREARVDPLVPGLTDTESSLEALADALARVGVRQTVASFLFLRWGIKFPNDLTLDGWSSGAMRRLYTHKVTNYCGGGTIWLPPAAYRTERLAAFEALAGARGIEVVVCRCKNADLSGARCCHPTEALAGEAGDRWREADRERVEGTGEQMTIF